MRRIVLAVCVLALGYAGWSLLRPRAAPFPADVPALLYDRVWLERAPKKLTDHVHALVILRAVPIGVFQKGSAYEAHLERFDYLTEGNGMRMRFPQSERRATVKFRLRACDEPPFDLCLELSENPWGGPRRYYSWREEHRHDLNDATTRAADRMRAEARP